MPPDASIVGLSLAVYESFWREQMPSSDSELPHARQKFPSGGPGRTSLISKNASIIAMRLGLLAKVGLATTVPTEERGPP